jgi:hypothetical protein
MASNLGYGKEDDSAVVKAVETMAGDDKKGGRE